MATESKFPWISSFWPAETRESGLQHLASHQLLKINNELTGIFSDHKEFKKIELPRLVVVGSQSSGKSSLLNGLMCMDFLPMGKTMVTRTPLDIRLTNTKNDGSGKGTAEFGNYNTGVWTVDKSFSITVPAPTKKEIESIRQEIETQTTKIAGPGKGISTTPIVIKIYSPYVPDLTLIDLPGLTAVACTDKGQPADIVKRIRDLASHYISQERTIILAVLPARDDLEADHALALAKEHDPEFKRTMGILTKVDLMNKDSDIGHILQGLGQSKDLRLQYGYHAVINRTTAESEVMSVQDGFKKEEEYFRTHSVYGKLDAQNRLGVPNLGINLSHILIDQIKKLLPDILHELIQMQCDIDKKLQDLGTPPPADAESKFVILNQLVTDFWKTFISSLEDRGAMINSGRRVKDIFIKFREEVKQMRVFETYEESYFVNAIKNCDGNHMSFPTPPVEVLEVCLKDPVKQPIRTLRAPALGCAKAINAELIILVDKLLAQDKFARFPKLVKKIREDVLNKILAKQQETIFNKLEDIIDTQESYIWTDDKEFQDVLSKMASEKTLSPTVVRALLSAYFETVKRIIQDVVPKTIMCFFVRRVEKQMSSGLIDKPDPITLLEESSDKANKRALLDKQRAKIESARKAIENN